MSELGFVHIHVHTPHGDFYRWADPEVEEVTLRDGGDKQLLASPFPDWVEEATPSWWGPAVQTMRAQEES